MEIQPEIKVKRKWREREKKRETRGKPVQRLAPSSIVQKAFYIFDKTWGSMGNTKLCSVSSPDSYQNQASLSAHLIVHTSLRWFTSSSDQKGQLTFYSLFSDKGLSTRLICVDLPKVWCHSQKALNKVTFLYSKDTRGVQWYITKRKVINSKV